MLQLKASHWLDRPPFHAADHAWGSMRTSRAAEKCYIKNCLASALLLIRPPDTERSAKMTSSRRAASESDEQQSPSDQAYYTEHATTVNSRGESIGHCHQPSNDSCI